MGDLLEKLQDDENAELAKATTPAENLAIETKWEKILDNLNEQAQKAVEEARLKP